jgi:putative FmdB family regulatory protein
MPIYEYACKGCRRKVSIFQRSITSTATPRCPECGSEELSRLVSKFAFHRAMPDFDDGPEFDEDMRQMGDRMGEDLPPDFDAQLAQMEADGFPDDGGGFDDYGFDD